MYDEVEGVQRFRSLKVSDLSIQWLKVSKSARTDTEPVGTLGVVESCLALLRFNEEKPFVEWMESRVNPEERRMRRVTLQGFVRGVHSDWLYKRMEYAGDGVIEVKVMEHQDMPRNFLRVKSLKGQPHDSRWHEIDVKPSGEAILVSRP